MALLRNIERKCKWWRFNNNPIVEPTEEQKRINGIRYKNARHELAKMFGTIESHCPGVIEKSMKQLRMANYF